MTVRNINDPSAVARRIPVILDTDIGSDIDDSWALALMLRCPELDVKLVTSDKGDTVYRAKLIAQMLESAGRSDVPIGIGHNFAHNRVQTKPKRFDPLARNYDLSSYRGQVHEDGVGAIIQTIMNSPELVTLVCIGAVPNIGMALEREPQIAQRARFVGMHGSIRHSGGPASPVRAECNVVNHTTDCQKAFTAAWDVTITPLDTCGQVVLRGHKYDAIRQCDDPLIRCLMEQYRVWSLSKFGREPGDASSTLCDTVAVYLAFAEELLKMERLPIRVTDEGFTVVDPAAGKLINCAMEWKDMDAFEDLLVDRLTKRKQMQHRL